MPDSGEGDNCQSRIERAQEIQSAIFEHDSTGEEYIDELHTLLGADGMQVTYEAVWGLNFISYRAPEAMVPIVDDIIEYLCVDDDILQIDEKLRERPYMTDDHVHYIKNLNLIQENPGRANEIGELMADSLDIESFADERKALNWIEEYIDFLFKKWTNLAILLLFSSVGSRAPDAVKPATEKLGSLLHDDWELIRTRAVRVLGFIGTEEALEMLADNIENEPSASVRHSYKLALLMNEHPEIVLDTMQDLNQEKQNQYEEFIGHIKSHKLGQTEQPQGLDHSEGYSEGHSANPQESINQAMQTTDGSYMSAYVCSLADLVKKTAKISESTHETATYLSRLEDTLQELDFDDVSQEEVLENIHRELSYLETHGDELGDERITWIQSTCDRIKEMCRRQPNNQ